MVMKILTKKQKSIIHKLINATSKIEDFYTRSNNDMFILVPRNRMKELHEAFDIWIKYPYIMKGLI